MYADIIAHGSCTNVSLAHQFVVGFCGANTVCIARASRSTTPYGRRQETHVCKICQRGNSPKFNQIVFCDECNTPYHQLCHNPQIDRIVVDVADAQWFCRDCQPRRRELPLETGITGEGLSLEMKKTYLSSLSKAQLVELIEYAETLEPKLPLYSPNTHSLALKMQLQNNKRLHQSGSKVDYEDLLVDAMNAKAMGKGVELSQIWSWIEKDTNSANTIDSSFLQSATRALQRALRRGRIIKNGNLYYVNPSYQPPSELSLSQYLSTDDEALFSEIPMRIPPPTEEDQYFCIDDNDEVFSHKVYIKT